MDLLNHSLYRTDLVRINTADHLPWEKLKNASVLLSGATGMIGSCLVDAIMYRNVEMSWNCSVYALGRNEKRAATRFARWLDHPCFHFIAADVNNPVNPDLPVDYVLHLASHTHPVAYATDPIGTITTNIVGTRNMLDLAVRCKARRFVFASSNEIYGENRGDREFFDETSMGYIDSNTLRAGYPESKRCGEALCQAYKKQEGLDVVVARLTRSFGPTLLPTDTKALSQFLRNALDKKDIVLKSAGNQYYSYTYAADAVTGILTVMLLGENGEAYNIADVSYDIRLKDLAQMIAGIAGTKVVFEMPSETESQGFSKATKARLDGAKLRTLGWQVSGTLEDDLKKTLDILKDVAGK
ncbi:MAG: NAD-dependent epimerase/dehydratase family protein [Bacteroidales bacterium]|nr:NAD-dependent epimerase/dehydratase family protein [Bacteroidales bacterium]